MTYSLCTQTPRPSSCSANPPQTLPAPAPLCRPRCPRNCYSWLPVSFGQAEDSNLQLPLRVYAVNVVPPVAVGHKRAREISASKVRENVPTLPISLLAQPYQVGAE